MTIEQIATLVILVLILGFGIWAYTASSAAHKEDETEQSS